MLQDVTALISIIYGDFPAYDKIRRVFGPVISDLGNDVVVLILANLHDCFSMILGNDIFVLIFGK